MIIRYAVVSSTIGLHARPAADFVRAVSQTGLAIRIAKVNLPGEVHLAVSADARSLLEVMTADFQFGEKVELSIDFPDDGAAGTIQDLDRQSLSDKLDELAAILENQ